MKAKNQPLSQAQFDKSMDRLLVILEKKADKDDVEKIVQKIVKKDVEKIVQKIVDENMILVANAFEKVATKEDLKDFVTKAYLKETLKDYPTKLDLEERLERALAPYATKEDMKEIIESAIEQFDSSVFATLRNHEKRITTLEQA